MCRIRIFFHPSLLKNIRYTVAANPMKKMREAEVKSLAIINKSGVGVVIISSPYTEVVSKLAIAVLRRIERSSTTSNKKSIHNFDKNNRHPIARTLCYWESASSIKPFDTKNNYS